MIREIIFHEDKYTLLNSKEEKQALVEEYSIKVIKEYKDVSD